MATSKFDCTKLDNKEFLSLKLPIKTVTHLGISSLLLPRLKIDTICPSFIAWFLTAVLRVPVPPKVIYALI